MTFSIVAYDPDEQACGVAVASKFLAAGALVSWASADAGAVATQSLMRVSAGPQGLVLLAEGKSAQETLNRLLADDNPNTVQRQVGIVDTRGGSAAHTGVACYEWAGHLTGEGYACQGNILAGPEVVNAMVSAFTSAKGELADRLYAALLAGDTAGGDRRGKQSAGLRVARPNGGYGGDTDRYLDLRVDDDPEPVKRLGQLLDLHHLYLGKPHPEDQLPITEDLARELQHMLLKQGYYKGEISGRWDEASKQAFWALVGIENLEERWHVAREPDFMDRVALDYLRERFK